MVVANRVIGRSDRFQRRLSSQEGRAMASRVNREVYARFCGRLEVKFLRPTRRNIPPGSPRSPAKLQYAQPSRSVLEGLIGTWQAPLPLSIRNGLYGFITEISRCPSGDAYDVSTGRLAAPSAAAHGARQKVDPQ